MLAIVNRTLSCNQQRDETGGVEGSGDEGLVDDAGHGQGVVSGDQGHVVDGCVADDASFGGREGEGYVALGDD